MIRRLLAIWNSDHTTIAIAALTIASSLNMINDVVARRTEAVEQINQQLAERTKQLRAIEAELGEATADRTAYPAAEDLSPLAAGEDDRG